MVRALLLVFAFLSLVSGQCSPTRGLNINGFCSCVSGSFDNTFSGELCGSFNDGCSYPTPQFLVTTPIAELMVSQSHVIGNAFTFLIQSPVLDGRRFTTVNLGLCGLDGVHYTTETRLDNCNDAIRGNFSIPEVANNCGFTRVDSATETTLFGDISITSVTPLGKFRETDVNRIISSTKSIVLHFPTTVTVTSSNITIVSPIDVMAAVIRQEYNGVDTITVELLTSVQYPYKLTSVALTQSQEGLNSGPASFLDIPGCLEGSGDCVQTTAFNITGFSLDTSCNLGANFTLQFNYDCRSGVDCPVDGSGVNEVVFFLESDDVCASLEFQSSISGSLESYSDDAYTTTSLAFLEQTPIFLRANIQADVAISAISIADVRATVAGRGAVVFSPTETGQTPNSIDFNITPALADFPLAQDLVVVTIDADLVVTYSTSFKRDVLQKELSFSKQIVLSPAH